MIPYEPDSYYVFDRGYTVFSKLFRMELIDAYFVVRAKRNLQFRTIGWKRRLPKNILSDKTPLRDLLSKTNFQDDKELCDPDGPSLFNYI